MSGLLLILSKILMVQWWVLWLSTLKPARQYSWSQRPLYLPRVVPVVFMPQRQMRTFARVMVLVWHYALVSRCKILKCGSSIPPEFMVPEHLLQKGVVEKAVTSLIKMASVLWNAMRQMQKILPVEMLWLAQWCWKFLKVEVAGLMVITFT